MLFVTHALQAEQFHLFFITATLWTLPLSHVYFEKLNPMKFIIWALKVT